MTAIPAIPISPGRVPWLTSHARLHRLTFFLKNISAKRCTPPGTRVAPQPPRVLDIGCGDAWFVKAAKCAGYDCIGTDTRGGTGIRAGADKLPFADNYFDCVAIWEVIEQVKPESYAEIKRVIRPGGHIILSTPKPDWNWLVKLCVRLGFASDRGTPHVNLIDVRKLPWELIKLSTILHIDQLAIFKV